MQRVKQPYSSPPRHPLSLTAPPPCSQCPLRAFCGPKVTKEPLFWKLKLPSFTLAPRASPQTPACSPDRLSLRARQPRSWPALGFSLTLLQSTVFPGVFSLQAEARSTQPLNFLPPPNDKPTSHFCSVRFTENHQGEKEKITKEPMWKRDDCVRTLHNCLIQQ